MKKETGIQRRRPGGLRGSRARRGRGLLAVLAPVAALAGIASAWPARKDGGEVQTAGTTARTPETEAFAQGALNTLLGDIRQEIAAGSKVVTVNPGVTVFAPKAPAAVVPAIVLGTAVNNGGLNNLAKRSARGQPFYPANGYYDTANYPAANRAAPAASETISLNGRAISAENWNRVLLLAKKDPANESVTPTGEFVSPDWVLASRDGSNPTVWSGSLIDTGSNPAAVVGRYAYHIYDEGGLLDASVAGYPSNTPPTQAARKDSLVFADLREVLDPNGSDPQGTATQIDAFIGWRNAHPHFSRQDLIDFIALQPVTSRVKLQNALQYLGTFSRGLEQPSFIKTQSVDASEILGYDAFAPKLLPPNSGGNNAGPSGSSGGLDAAINPSFLTVRVKTTTVGGRFGGADLVAGEPLVKKRFPLSRLAWLTYAGPIASDDGSTLNPTGNSGVNAIIAALENAHGYTDAFLRQGTAENIRSCFGLTWDAASRRWNYNVHNRGGSTGPICKLSYAADAKDVLRDGREADFFELLKASVNVGSLGKAGTTPTPTQLPGGTSGSYQSQYNDDSRVDDAIIQMGANIIDQFDLDGYSSQIYFNDGGTTSGKTFRGVENLPYLSRLVHALVKVKQAEVTSSNGTISSIADTGVGALLQCPELWNPHDYHAATPEQVSQTMGIVGPTKFRIYAESGAQGINDRIDLRGLLRDQGSFTNLGHSHTQANAVKSPGYASKYGFSFNLPEQRSLSLSNTGMIFTVNREATGLTRFREPTILFQTSANGGHVEQGPAPGNFGIISANSPFFVGGAFKSDVGSGIAGVPPIQGAGYVGFYLGALPLCWSDAQVTGSPGYWLDNISLIAPVDVRYYLQYLDANDSWVTYDEKFRTLGGSGSSEHATLCGGGARSAAGNGWESFFYPRNTGSLNNWDSAYAAMDPRTSRFGLMKLTAGRTNARYWAYAPYGADSAGVNTPNRTATATRVGFAQGWIDATKGVTLGTRNGIHDGAGFFCPLGVLPDTMGWVPGTGGSVSGNANGRFASCNGLNLGAVAGNMICRPGVFSQNNPYARRDDLPWGDPGDTVTGFSASAVSNAAEYYTDADGVVRRASGGLVPYSTGPATTNTGLPMTAANTNGTTRLDQSDSRPVILNRPFRTVGELAYTFSGTPWKNINFSMPESGDTALLDVFSVNDIEAGSGLAVGKVNLNTRQAPVLQAILAGAYKDEWKPGTNTVAGGGANSPAAKMAQALVNRTSVGVVRGSNSATPQPLANMSELVGRYVGGYSGTTGPPNPDSSLIIPSTGHPATIFSPKNYDGFSADLTDNRYAAAGSGVLLDAADTNATIPRFAEAALRALSGSGQTRVWNLLIDVVAQTGRYSAAANSLDAFTVTGEQRYWLHMALDRYSGEVLDQSLEAVPETFLTLSSLVVPEDQPAGTLVGAFGVLGTNSANDHVLTLVGGEGGEGNFAFTLSGNQLRTAAVFRYLTRGSYNLRVRATDMQTGASFEQKLSISILPGPYTRWKLAYFPGQANDLAVAGDTADPDQDGLINLLEYALGRSPAVADGSGITAQQTAGALRMNYTRLSAATDVTVHACQTSDLQDAASWSTVGVTETLLHDDGTIQQWQAAVPESAGQKLFMRLQVTRP